MLNRTACDVLEEMRTCVKVLNFAPMLSLIEEIQIMFSRMENKLYTIKDFEHLEREIKRLKKKQSAIKEDVGEKENHWD